MLIFIFIAAFVSTHAPRAQTSEPDAKSIPKAILMLGLYCNAANTALKPIFEKNPRLTPWRAERKRLLAFNDLFSKLDFARSGNDKAVRDKALTEGEVKFLDLTAQKDATNWGLLAPEKCGGEEGELLAQCLRELNTEIYKCYQILNSEVEKRVGAP